MTGFRRGSAERLHARGLTLPAAWPSPPRWAITTFGLALGLRVTFVIVQLKLHVFDLNFNAPDSAGYRRIATALVHTGHYSFGGHPTAYRTPGYPLLLALLFQFSRSTMFIALCQAILGAATCVVLGYAARHLGGKRAAWATGLIAACYPELIYWTGFVITETLYVFVIALSLLALARLLEAPTGSRALITGLLFGAATLVRPVILGLAIVLIVWGLLLPRWRRAAAVGAAGLAVALAPWVVRNELALHTLTVSTQSGMILYEGDSPHTNAGSGGYLSAGDFKPLHLRPGLSEVQINDAYQSAALRWMRDHPVQVLARVPHKLWNMWRPTYAGSSTLNKLVTYSTYPLLLLLGFCGLVLARRRGPLGWVLIAFVVYHLVFHALVFGTIRYRLPIEAVLTITAGMAVSHLWAGLIAHRPRPLRAPCLLGSSANATVAHNIPESYRFIDPLF